MSRLGAQQDGIGTEFWAITAEQLARVAHAVPRTATMRAVVEDFVKPKTARTGMGYAMTLNHKAPHRAALICSHSWGEKFHDFYVALKESCCRGPFWICATAIYHNEDNKAVKIAKQLGPDPKYGPKAIVLRQADGMVEVDACCDTYTRMWCVHEMAIVNDEKLYCVQRFG
jgi:hypothetical protein